jgi:hypothetical protein
MAASSRGAVVDVYQDSVRSTTCLGLVAVARVVAASGQGVRTSDQVAVGCNRTSVALLVVFGTTNRQAASCAGVEAVSDGGVVSTASHAHDVGQHATIGAIGVASHQVPRAVASAGVELVHPGVVHVDGKTVSGTAGLGLVAAASHVAVGGLCAGGGCGVGAIALASVFGASVLVSEALAGGCTLVGSVVAAGTSTVGQDTRVSVNEATVRGEASGKRECGGR